MEISAAPCHSWPKSRPQELQDIGKNKIHSSAVQVSPHANAPVPIATAELRFIIQRCAFILLLLDLYCLFLHQKEGGISLFFSCSQLQWEQKLILIQQWMQYRQTWYQRFFICSLLITFDMLIAFYFFYWYVWILVLQPPITTWKYSPWFPQKW